MVYIANNLTLLSLPEGFRMVQSGRLCFFYQVLRTTRNQSLGLNFIDETDAVGDSLN